MTQERKLYAIIRKDLDMPKGKMAAQAGHAYLNSFLEADPQIQQDYQKDGIGTKICLEGSLIQIKNTYAKAKAAGLPCSLIRDSGHILLPFFDGNPIVTALGIGPLNKDEAKIVKKYELVKE